MSNVLVVYYSRTGGTRQVAQTIADALGADVEEIVDTHDRKGFLGYLRSGFGAMLAKPAAIEEPVKDPAAYRLVIVGTPVWGSAVSTPVLAYLQRRGRAASRVAFFLTHGGSGAERVFRQMEALCGKHSIASLALRMIELPATRSNEKVEAFLAAAKREIQVPHVA
jgi:flavodoxin